MSALVERLPRQVGLPSRLHAVAVAGLAVFALATVLTPWYALDDYTPNGWDATWWARIALAAALVAIAALRLGEERAAAAMTALAFACVAFRTLLPPDFGFDFDGLEVPTARSWGLWVALAGALVALAATMRILTLRRSS